MAQPTKCDFCGRPRRKVRSGTELLYLVDISGPYLENFDPTETDRRSANRKRMWGCHDCVNVIYDTEYWARWDEKMGHNNPYTILNDDHRKAVLPLLHRHPARMTMHEAARKYPPTVINARRQKKAVNE